MKYTVVFIFLFIVVFSVISTVISLVLGGLGASVGGVELIVIALVSAAGAFFISRPVARKLTR
ncbi:hypothetical protein ACFSSC_10440 [Corynebacterium mendelii]|uniref:Uncharacterized protein n=1 Tax=Corynebacterium mendelii TaxID=2765362 RepID=A0A939DZV5_9CORY|nr:hypothetical protein [Corynebacterium mendelii]MBN9644319.1 hypothetical protein [Corynebacterium mendelii]